MNEESEIVNEIGKILEEAGRPLNSSKNLDELDNQFRNFAGKKSKLNEILHNIHLLK